MMSRVSAEALSNAGTGIAAVTGSGSIAGGASIVGAVTTTGRGGASGNDAGCSENGPMRRGCTSRGSGARAARREEVE
jgi:hypothetical protein